MSEAVEPGSTLQVDPDELLRLCRLLSEAPLSDDDFARPIGRASLLVPGVSILLHVLTLHWLYDLPIYGAYLTPLYLGIAVNVPGM